MLRSSFTVTRLFALSAAALFLAGCNPGSESLSGLKAKNVSYARVASAKNECRYDQSKARAIGLLDKGGAGNRRRAGKILSRADRCMARRGINTRSGSVYTIGRKAN